MTERLWLKLKPGDEIMNKRQPGIILTVVANDNGDVQVRAPHGVFSIKRLRHEEFVLRLQQTKLGL